MQRRERQDLRPLLVAQFGAHHTRQPGAYRVTRLVDEYASVVVEFHPAAIFPLLFLVCSDDHSVPYVSSLHLVGDTQAATSRSFLTKRALFLDDHDYSISCIIVNQVSWYRLCDGDAPILAVGLIPLFFITATHSTIAAPELSMQLSIVWVQSVLEAPIPYRIS